LSKGSPRTDFIRVSLVLAPAAPILSAPARRYAGTVARRKIRYNAAFLDEYFSR
jgi:hypothetical protein